jgi:hypothetical protein
MALVKHNNNSISAITTAGQLATGSMVLIKEQSASSSSSISFVDGSSSVILDSTYPIYLFKFINIHPATNETKFQVNMSIDGGSNYNVTKTTTYFRAYNAETENAYNVTYYAGGDLAQSTGFQYLTLGIGNANDASASGELYLFNPSSTTFSKHFIARTSENYVSTYILDNFVSGYCNTTSAVDAVQFAMSSGNIDAGTIKLYGIKDS